MLQPYVRCARQTASFDPVALCVRAQIQVSDLRREHQPDQPVGDIGHGPPHLANGRALSSSTATTSSVATMIGISKRRSVAEFARLGIQTYGFLPMQLPREMRFMDLMRAADERSPFDAVRWAAESGCDSPGAFSAPSRPG
jgi:hypothetical protein